MNNFFHQVGEITILKIECEANEKFIKDMYCRLRSYNRNYLNITAQGTFIQPLQSFKVCVSKLQPHMLC
jgi:hypothetical protein